MNSNTLICPSGKKQNRYAIRALAQSAKSTSMASYYDSCWLLRTVALSHSGYTVALVSTGRRQLVLQASQARRNFMNAVNVGVLVGDCGKVKCPRRGNTKETSSMTRHKVWMHRRREGNRPSRPSKGQGKGRSGSALQSAPEFPFTYQPRREKLATHDSERILHFTLIRSKKTYIASEMIP